MNDINKEMEAVAEKIEKSTIDYDQKLIDTIIQLGPEGLKKAMETLEEKDLIVLKAALTEIKKSNLLEKAANTPEKIEDAPTGKKIVTKFEEAKHETEKADDEEDEKLVKEKNKEVKHQGDDSTEIKGQVIKSEDSKKKDNKIEGGKGDELSEKSVCPKQLAAGIKIEMEHTKDEAKAKEIALDHLAESPNYYIKENGKNRLEELESEAKKEMKKSMDINDEVERLINKSYDKSFSEDPKLEAKEDLKKKAPKGVDPKKHEKCVMDVKKQGKDVGSAHAICTSSMKKSELIALKEKVIKSLENDNLEITPDLIKGKMKELLIEEITRTETKIEKSITWDAKNLLKANTLGRNFHFEVNGYYDSLIKAVNENSEEETLEKAKKSTKSDINDMIEEGKDLSLADFNNKELLKKK